MSACLSKIIKQKFREYFSHSTTQSAMRQITAHIAERTIQNAKNKAYCAQLKTLHNEHSTGTAQSANRSLAANKSNKTAHNAWNTPYCAQPTAERAQKASYTEQRTQCKAISVTLAHITLNINHKAKRIERNKKKPRNKLHSIRGQAAASCQP